MIKIVSVALKEEVIIYRNISQFYLSKSSRWKRTKNNHAKSFEETLLRFCKIATFFYSKQDCK
jgi:hypothetical protein